MIRPKYTVISGSDMRLINTCLYSLLEMPLIKEERKVELRTIRAKIKRLPQAKPEDTIHDDTYGNLDPLKLTPYEWNTVVGALHFVRQHAKGWPEDELKQIDQIQWALSDQQISNN